MWTGYISKAEARRPCRGAKKYRNRPRAAHGGVPAMDAKKGLLLLAGLVGDAAAGLAGALAGGLAFAAAAVVQALGHIAGVESLDVLHKTVTPFI